MKPLLIYRWRVAIAEAFDRHGGAIMFTLIIGGMLAIMAYMLAYNPTVSFPYIAK